MRAAHSSKADKISRLRYLHLQIQAVAQDKLCLPAAIKRVSGGEDDFCGLHSCPDLGGGDVANGILKVDAVSTCRKMRQKASHSRLPKGLGLTHEIQPGPLTLHQHCLFTLSESWDSPIYIYNANRAQQLPRCSLMSVMEGVCFVIW